MYKIVKLIATVFIFSATIALTSCLNANDPIERTPDLELQEINDAITQIEEEGYDVDTTALGVYYVVHDAGIDSLPTIMEGDTCFLEYEGYLLDGTMFDGSKFLEDDAIWEFVYGDVDLIPGFDNGISLMRKGSRIDLLIPSILAYGPVSYGLIQPYSPLVFYLKMHDVKPKAN